MVVMILGSGFEPVEAIAPCDILRRGGVEVQLAGIGGTMIEAGHGITVKADCTVEEADFEHAEMVVLPGGLAACGRFSAARRRWMPFKRRMKTGSMSLPSARAPRFWPHFI